VVPASTRTPKMSSSLRTATRPPERANTKMPRRSSATSNGGGPHTRATLRVAAPAKQKARRQAGRGLPGGGSEQMRDLTPVRLTGGGTQLVLVDGEGMEYAAPIARVHQVLGNARGVQERAESATGTTSATPTRGIRKEKVNQRMDQKRESALRPRDIQSRIRAGESPEGVGAVAGTCVEKIMVFAAPVLAERAHIARSAQSSSVRRTAGDPSSTGRALAH